MRIENIGGKIELFRKQISTMPLYLSFARDINSCEIVNRILSSKEKLRYQNLKSDIAKKDYLLGRAAAKYALNGLFNKKNYFSYEISNGIFGEPLVDNAEVSISHSKGFAVAVASSERLYCGVDTEYISNRYTRSILSLMTDNEKKIIYNGIHELLFWTAKEAISKVFHTGLASNFHIYEIKEVSIVENGYMSSFSNFPQYIAYSFIIDNHMTTMVAPSKIKIDLTLTNGVGDNKWNNCTE